MNRVYAAALALTIAIALQQPARAHHDSPPRVPGNIQVPAGNKLFLVRASARRTTFVFQSASGFMWTLFGPQATLFDAGATAYIQRLNTVGGVAPATGCSVGADVGKRALVSYEADYFFCRERRNDRDDD